MQGNWRAAFVFGEKLLTLQRLISPDCALRLRPQAPKVKTRSMAQTKVLFISQEITPYLAENPRTLLGRELPQGVAENGYEVRTFMPKYGAINERRNQLHEVIRLSGLNIPIDDNDHPLVIKVATLLPVRMQVYFIDSDDYFHKPPVKGLETETDKEDNDERSMFYVRGVAETVKKLRWEPAVIQCDGWITALSPMYLKRLYADEPSFCNSKIVYTLHNDAFEGSLDSRFVDKLLQEGLTKKDLKAITKGEVDHKALTRLAIDYADAIMQADADVDSELIQYAEKSGKPFLKFTTEEERTPRLVAFYEELLKK